MRDLLALSPIPALNRWIADALRLACNTTGVADLDEALRLIHFVEFTCAVVWLPEADLSRFLSRLRVIPRRPRLIVLSWAPLHQELQGIDVTALRLPTSTSTLVRQLVRSASRDSGTVQSRAAGARGTASLTRARCSWRSVPLGGTQRNAVQALHGITGVFGDVRTSRDAKGTPAAPTLTNEAVEERLIRWRMLARGWRWHRRRVRTSAGAQETEGHGQPAPVGPVVSSAGECGH